MATPNSTNFHPTTEHLLARAGVTTAPTFLDIQLSQLTTANVNHVLTDWDGVLSPYGKKPASNTLEYLGHIANNLEFGVTIASSHYGIDFGVLPENVRSIAAASITDCKPRVTLLRRALSMTHSTPAETLGVGDGLTDVIAYKRMNIGNICLVKSCGPHPMQKVVHDYIYSPGVALISKLHITT